MRQLQRADRYVNLGRGIVYRERRATGGVKPQMRNQWARAILARPDSDAFLVKNGRNVMRMGGTLHRERENGGLVERRPL